MYRFMQFTNYIANKIISSKYEKSSLYEQGRLELFSGTLMIGLLIGILGSIAALFLGT